MVFADIIEEKIRLEKYISTIHMPETGGMVTFSGIVRNHNHGKKVDYLDYESHTVIAKKVITEILIESTQKWPIQFALAVHRTGRLKIGEIAVLVITCSAHRKEAYEANQFIIDKLKIEAPIWKKETFTDGSSVWGNNCDCHHHNDRSAIELSENPNQAFIPPDK